MVSLPNGQARHIHLGYYYCLRPMNLIREFLPINQHHYNVTIMFLDNWYSVSLPLPLFSVSINQSNELADYIKAYNSLHHAPNFYLLSKVIFGISIHENMKKSASTLFF